MEKASGVAWAAYPGSRWGLPRTRVLGLQVELKVLSPTPEHCGNIAHGWTNVYTYSTREAEVRPEAPSCPLWGLLFFFFL